MIGIYLLKQDDLIVYVGKSKNIETRVPQHKLSLKEFTSYDIIECNEDEMYNLEISYIKKHCPKYNFIYNKENYNPPQKYLDSINEIETQMVRVNKETIPKLKEMKYDFRVDSLTAVIDKLVETHDNNKNINASRLNTVDFN